MLYSCKGCSDEPTSEPEATAPARRHDVLTISHRTFTDDEWAVLEAACARILPGELGPGAISAHVPDYIDRMLAAPELTRMRQDVIGGLDALDRRGRRMFHKGFPELSDAQKDELITLFKDAPVHSAEAGFYLTLIQLTMEGFLGDPSYGGNFNRVGWEMVGFDTAAPPEGYDGISKMRRYPGG